MFLCCCCCCCRPDYQPSQSGGEMGLHPELLPARQSRRWGVNFSFGIIHQGSRVLPTGTTVLSTILTFKELLRIYAAVTAALTPSHQSSKEILTCRRAAWMWNQSWALAVWQFLPVFLLPGLRLPYICLHTRSSRHRRRRLCRLWLYVTEIDSKFHLFSISWPVQVLRKYPSATF